MRIEKDHVIIVHLRPSPGLPAPDPVIVKATLDNRTMVNVGKAGELVFSHKDYLNVGRRQLDYDKVDRVFAPHAWLYYEYSEETP